MAAGLPVVATPNHGARYVTDEGRFGVLRDIHAIDQPLVDLLTDAGERARMGSLSLTRAREFDLGAVVDQYEAIYRSRRRKGRSVSSQRSPKG
jgi:glycosyltransferase involved in cell wall biosynthesis